MTTKPIAERWQRLADFDRLLDALRSDHLRAIHAEEAERVEPYPPPQEPRRM
jgi:hypothetical protein